MVGIEGDHAARRRKDADVPVVGLPTADGTTQWAYNHPVKSIVPNDSLRPETLRAVIEEFVTRSGAVHGHTDTPLHTQIESVRRRLQSGQAVIVYDPATDSCTICPIEEVRVPRTKDQSAGSVDGGTEPPKP